MTNDGLEVNLQDCINWLDAKYRRHGEYEDLKAKEYLQEYAQSLQGNGKAVGYVMPAYKELFTKYRCTVVEPVKSDSHTLPVYTSPPLPTIEELEEIILPSLFESPYPASTCRSIAEKILNHLKGL